MRLGSHKFGLAGLMITIGALAMLLSGCSPSTSSHNTVLSADKQIFKPQDIGPASGDLETLDPALVEFGTDYDKAQRICPALSTIDDKGKSIDGVAGSHSVSMDRLTYPYKLCLNLRGSD